MSQPWMPLYIADYLADTAHLSAAESGAYLHLIMTYWRHGKLPADDTALARIARMSAKEWARSKATLQAFFHDSWQHKRIDSELEKAAQKSEARSESGSRGGIAKALKEKEARVANATILPQQTTQQNDDFAIASSSQSHRETKVSLGRAKRATRLPDDWQPKSADNGPLAEQELPKFRDYWRAKAGKDGAKLDWDATWRNWQRNARPAFGQKPPQPFGHDPPEREPMTPEQEADGIRKWHERLRELEQANERIL